MYNRLLISKLYATLMYLVAVITLTACEADASRLIVETDKGKVEFIVELAISHEEKSRGLKFRTDLKRNQGMLFVYKPPQKPTFWMKDTPTSLDLIYIDENQKIISIRYSTVPFSTRSLESPQPVAGVLEIPAGSAKIFGLKAGQKVAHYALQ